MAENVKMSKGGVSFFSDTISGSEDYPVANMNAQTIYNGDANWFAELDISDWNEITLASGITAIASPLVKDVDCLCYRKDGNLITIAGRIQMTLSTAAQTYISAVGAIPDGLRPSYTVMKFCNTSAVSITAIGVLTDGSIVHRYTSPITSTSKKTSGTVFIDIFIQYFVDNYSDINDFVP